MGKNAANLETFKSDLENLIGYICYKAPNVRIIVVGDWWDKNRNELRKAAALDTNSGFTDLS